MTNWRDNWTGVSPFGDPLETDKIIDYFMLNEPSINIGWWTVYGSTRSILGQMGLDISKPHVFHKEKYIGSSLDEVKTYIYTMKRIYGEA